MNVFTEERHSNQRNSRSRALRPRYNRPTPKGEDFFKGTSTTTRCAADGVSTYLALTFGTLLSSQGADASFETVSPAPPGASFVFQLSRSADRLFRFPAGKSGVTRLRRPLR